jgi:uncharacterized repeat protein (TIGR03803 family)
VEPTLLATAEVTISSNEAFSARIFACRVRENSRARAAPLGASGVAANLTGLLPFTYPETSHMRTLARFALSIGIAAAFLAGCGGSQPLISAPGTIPQAPAIAARATSTNYKVVYSFGGSSDGSGPHASLIDVGGTLYGTTAGGGSYPGCGLYRDCGTVFRITTSGSEKVLYSFGGTPDGGVPLASLVDAGSTLYGTTQFGGSYISCDYFYTVGCGTVFSITPSGQEKVLHSFGKGSDGFYPSASLIEVKGVLYGTTKFGYLVYGHYECNNSQGCGIVFSITRSGREKVLHRFGSGSDGVQPGAGLIDVKGTLYGTTTQGGGAYCTPNGGCGTVFTITPSGVEKVLHSFNETDGAGPQASLVELKGKLYGTTTGGGEYHDGTVFSITPAGKEKVLHSFGGGADGATPVASLIKVKGALYGTTENGGAYACGTVSCGTVFRITTSGTLTVLHTFGDSSSDGRFPYAGLTDLGGTLYGTTKNGGTYGHGTVFALTP